VRRVIGVRLSGPPGPSARCPPTPIVRVRRDDRVHGAGGVLRNRGRSPPGRAALMAPFGPKTPGGDRGRRHNGRVQPQYTAPHDKRGGVRTQN